ncbi:hypothetical protein [Pseudoalteromonas rubra]|uniref:hypothetical protein n=1 Tax=Pseudoalteromonas rubra TaxID=43658 RepID=UPI001BB2A6AF|nr:hypothetical protein [Pseudoalteromonas rubra]
MAIGKENNVRRIIDFAIYEASSSEQLINYINKCERCSDEEMVRILESVTAFGFYVVSQKMHATGYRISDEQYDSHISMSCSNGEIEMLKILLNRSYYIFKDSVVF